MRRIVLIVAAVAAAALSAPSAIADSSSTALQPTAATTPGQHADGDCPFASAPPV